MLNRPDLELIANAMPVSMSGIAYATVVAIFLVPKKALLKR